MNLLTRTKLGKLDYLVRLSKLMILIGSHMMLNLEKQRNNEMNILVQSLQIGANVRPRQKRSWDFNTLAFA